MKNPSIPPSNITDLAVKDTTLFVSHLRYVDGQGKKLFRRSQIRNLQEAASANGAKPVRVLPNGGRTVAAIVKIIDGIPMQKEVIVVCNRSDVFTRKHALRIACGRLAKKISGIAPWERVTNPVILEHMQWLKRVSTVSPSE